MYIPKLRLHKPSGRAVVTIRGKHVYLGKYGTREADDAYNAILKDLVNHQDDPPTAARVNRPQDLTIADLIPKYMEYVRSYYVKDGKPKN